MLDPRPITGTSTHGVIRKDLFKTIDNRIGKKGTILMPAFTPSFCKKKKFYKDSKENELGSFGKIFTEKKFFKRRY